MALFHMQGVPIGPIAIMLALLASMGGFIFGYDTGQISDILLMDDFLLRFATCQEGATLETASDQCAFGVWRAGAIVALLSIGTLVGALFGAPTAEFFGRRYAMVVECLVFIVGVIVQITAFSSWEQFAVGRLISGLGVGALSAAVPMYQAETAPSAIRGMLTATYQLFITFGILVAYCICIGTRNIVGPGSWQSVVGIGIVWPVILGVGILFMPESPRWLATKERYDEAHVSIARSHGIPRSDAHTHDLVTRQVEEIRNNIEWERDLRERELMEIEHGSASSFGPGSGKGATATTTVRHRSTINDWLDCFRPRGKVLYRTLLGMSLQSLQQLTGANYFFYYGATIFKSVGIQDSFITQIILGAVNFGCTFLGLYVMHNFGRRKPLIIGGIWQSAWLFVFAAAGTAKNPETDQAIGKLMIISACLFILGYATTWAPCVWILIGETFPTRTRAKQAAISTASNWLWNFLLAFFTTPIVNSIRFSYGFVFAGCNLLGAIVVYFFLYESANLTLEAVDRMYNDPKCKPWTSSEWVPEGEGYQGRRDLVEQSKAAEAGKGFESDFGGKEEGRVENASGPRKDASGANGGKLDGVDGKPYTMAPSES
ncbi:hypothetical protein D9758_002546 [Tetrapyrgos nigripes]|uniref:Major facilitator superfamily (MFS) profile domain-containing protein n=1 Tax=Tetrapyrgos nigripes TaxID=182062 RepID=A0A8H5GR64_9AGAR|nr:hypothetical protein D9758_002546 [Tetrapyrgos nigripes]